MICAIDILFFQQYWWFIISLLAGILVFLLFVQGGQTLINTLGKNELQRTLIVNALGRKWEFTFTTLVTFGGAFFASFPLFYSSSFGGAYWVWMTVLFCFIIQAVSYEFRSKPNNVFGSKFFEAFLFINGVLGPFLLGVIVSTMFTGSMFSINDMNQVTWHTKLHGLEALGNPVNLILGAAIFFLARTQALLYFINAIDQVEIQTRSRQLLSYNAVPFLIFFILFIAIILSSTGYSYTLDNVIEMEKFKYLHNFLTMPAVLILFLAGVVGVIIGLYLGVFSNSRSGIWYTGSGTIVTVVMLFLILGYNHTSFYPSSFDLQSSLTIENASSSLFTLKIMSYVSLMVPIVAFYIFITWRAINKSPLSETEIKSESHIY